MVMNICILEEPLIHAQCCLGESPIWDPLGQHLYWLDIEAGKLFRADEFGKGLCSFELGKKCGAIALCQKGKLLVATETGLAFWQEETGLGEDYETFFSPDQGLMMNDGKVDSLGRFWVGNKGPKGKAALFKVESGAHSKIVQEGVTISNGIDWSPDDQWCYYTDSGTQTIYKYRFDVQHGMMTDRENFFRSNTGTPDGLTVDAAGNIWTAIWDGAKIMQLSPNGEILTELLLPVNRPTSVIFGGKKLQTLFITTAWTELPDEIRVKQPFAGDVFAFSSDIPGRLSKRFIE